MLLLSPFLDVVRSGDTSGPITALALASVDKFITYSLVHRDSPNLQQAMTGVAGAGTHCKFEASDSVSDEAVLLKILDVLRHTLTSDLGGVLSDEAVCEMMETGLSMCCQMRLSGPSSCSQIIGNPS
jgi:brefeldin A-resistance guanine nucleotide exchange factor 1